MILTQEQVSRLLDLSAEVVLAERAAGKLLRKRPKNPLKRWLAKAYNGPLSGTAENSRWTTASMRLEDMLIELGMIQPESR